MTRLVPTVVAFGIPLLVTPGARAAGDAAPAPAPAPTPTETAAAPPPAPYVSPFSPRGVGVATALRLEASYGLDADVSNTVVEFLTAAYAFNKHISIYGRTGWVEYLPSSGPSTSAFTNLAIGALWADTFAKDFRYCVTIGTGLPVGQGGGDSPDTGEAAAIGAGNLARARWDGSTMFSPNDVAPFIGGDLAFVKGGFTIQAEVSVFSLFRVRGDGINPATSKPWDPDAVKGSIDLGLHVGYFIVPQLSIQAEVRDQTFLGTPAAVSSGAIAQSWVSVGGGVRGHFKIGAHAWFRPGLAFFQPLNDAVLKPIDHTASSYHIFLLDLPVSF